MRIPEGMLYMRGQTARRIVGGTPNCPHATIGGEPVYTARQLRPVLADSARCGRIPARRAERWFYHFSEVLAP